jgi:hypothetical protein
MCIFVRLTLSLAVLFVFAVSARAQNNCDPLQPNPPRTMSREIVGKIDTKVDGLAKRFLSAGLTADGVYREVSNDVLKEYKNADKLFLWERTIYLLCINIIQAKISDSEKLDRIEKLMKEISQPPTEKPRTKIFDLPSFAYKDQFPAGQYSAYEENQGQPVFYSYCLDQAGRLCNRRAADHICRKFGFTGTNGWKLIEAGNRLVYFAGDQLIDLLPPRRHDLPAQIFSELACL